MLYTFLNLTLCNKRKSMIISSPYSEWDLIECNIRKNDSNWNQKGEICPYERNDSEWSVVNQQWWNILLWFVDTIHTGASSEWTKNFPLTGLH